MLELPDWEFKTTMINRLWALMDKVDKHARTDGHFKKNYMYEHLDDLGFGDVLVRYQRHNP